MKMHRNVLGAANPKAKLVEGDIPLIRELLREGVQRKVIAEKFEVTYDTIAKIAQGATWVHI